MSRAGADSALSETVAGILERAGYGVILQQRNFANKSFIHQMQSALESGARVVALLSPGYLASDYCAAEWQSVLADDPLNKRSRLIVLRVAQCAPTGLLKALAYWDLAAVDDPQTFESVVLQAVGARTSEALENGAPASGSAAAAAIEDSTNLPAQLTAFIGRTQVVAEIKARSAESRLVTLLGAGGIGKTRTALRVASELHDGSGDGVWFVDLAPLGNAAYVVPEIASIFGVREEDGKPLLETVLAYLKSKRLLLVLDNCEHVVVEARGVADAILRACPGIDIIATSREALGVDGEFVFRLPTLGVPPEDEALTAQRALEYEAVALFAARARAADGRFTLTDANAAMVADICRRLDGIALALELAAARIKVLNLTQLGSKLTERFRLLTGGSKTALPRQQTMRALIDWSYDLLDAPERRLFRRLSVFAGGWTLEAATSVCGDEDEDEFVVLDRLTSLADKSLVVVDFSAEAQRFRFLESMRAYALDLVRSGGEFEALAERRATYFATFAGDGRTVGTGVSARFAAIEAELENVREVLHWALEERHAPELGARLAFALGRFWSTQQPREGQRWLKLAQSAVAEGTDVPLGADIASAIAAMLPHGSFERIEATERALAAARATREPRILTKALAAYGEQLAPLGKFAEAEAAFDEALLRARENGSEWDAARALAGLATLAVDREDIVRAREFGAQALESFEALGATDGVAYVCITLGEAEFKTGDAESALALVRRAREAHGALNNHRSSACAANCLAAYSLALERVDEARAHARDTLDLLRTDRHPLFLMEAIALLAYIATLGGDERRGSLLHGYVTAAHGRLAHPRSISSQYVYDRHARALVEKLGPQELTRRMAEGALLTEERAYEEALAV